MKKVLHGLVESDANAGEGSVYVVEVVQRLCMCVTRFRLDHFYRLYTCWRTLFCCGSCPTCTRVRVWWWHGLRQQSQAYRSVVLACNKNTKTINHRWQHQTTLPAITSSLLLVPLPSGTNANLPRAAIILQTKTHPSLAALATTPSGRWCPGGTKKSCIDWGSVEGVWQ